MYRYKKLMVCLNLDDHDHTLIEYAGFISKMAKSEEILFIYVSDTFDIPEDIKKIYPQLKSPVDEALVERLEEVVRQHHIGDDKTRITFKALEGPMLGTLISYTKDQKIDLLIVGHYSKETASNNYLSEKLARKAFCSVLIIPPSTKVNLEKILIPIDFPTIHSTLWMWAVHLPKQPGLTLSTF